MSASTVKGDRKREIGQSPIKKKFRDSTISREDIDEAIANGIKLAFKEQQSTLDSVVTSAVRDAVDSVLIPALRKLREDIQATNNSVKELREEMPFNPFNEQYCYVYVPVCPYLVCFLF